MTPYLNLKKRPALVTLSLLCAFILPALSSRTTIEQPSWSAG